jgi:hypothetical protein
VPGGGVEPPRAEARRILSILALFWISLIFQYFQSLQQLEGWRSMPFCALVCPRINHDSTMIQIGLITIQARKVPSLSLGGTNQILADAFELSLAVGAAYAR